MLALPSEIAQQQLLRDQLEHHRRQQAEEQSEKTAGAPKRTKSKALATLFALVSRKIP